MYERFTDRSRDVIRCANKEAQRFSHEYIGTEHILLGLIEEGRGVAVNVPKNLDVDLNKLRFDVVRLLESRPDLAPTSGKLPQIPRAKKVIEYAMEEARSLNHNYVGTEHLLLGLLRVQEGIASAVLKDQGLELNRVREETLNLLGHGLRVTPTPVCPPALVAIEDLPDELKVPVATLDTEIRRFQAEKEEAIANQEFKKAASQRDEECKVSQRRGALIHDWLASHPIDPGWLSANDSAVLKLARTISEQQDWRLLPNLADALERAGCTDTQFINHCRQPGEHSHRCWVIDLLLADASV